MGMPDTVNAVTGPLPAEMLGVTLMHEHVCIGAEGILLDSRFELDPAERFAEATRSLTAARAAGIDTIVDATPIDLNRDAAFLREVSEASGVNVVCSTGLYMETHGVPAHFRQMSVDELSSLYVEEIERGIGRTNVRAGVIKVATSEHGVTDVNRKLLEAAAVAQAATGVPVISHTSGGHGVEQAATLTGAGAAPHQVMIGHVDHKYSSHAYFERILRTGVSIAFDRCGLGVFMPDAVRAALFAGFVQLGLESRVYLSMDSTSVHLGPRSPLEKDAEEPLVYLVTGFAELLERFGVPRRTFDAVLTANPARLFRGEPVGSDRPATVTGAPQGDGRRLQPG